MAKIQSVEPNIADLANGWMKSYKLDYKLEQESLNPEFDTTQIWAKVPSKQLSDALVDAFKDKL